MKHPELRIQHAGWECVLQIASEFYPFLDAYASDLGKHSIDTVQAAMAAMDQAVTSDDVKRRTEAVALAALEFWNTICDVEVTMLHDETGPPCKHYIKQAKDVLLPVLFEAMTKQGAESVDLEEWTLAMAAGTCVGLCAQVLGDDIIEPALEFVNTNFGDCNWKRREAAVLAYGMVYQVCYFIVNYILRVPSEYTGSLSFILFQVLSWKDLLAFDWNLCCSNPSPISAML